MLVGVPQRFAGEGARRHTCPNSICDVSLRLISYDI
jgi:hypothetical protein